jgi:hypothetical protein
MKRKTLLVLILAASVCRPAYAAVELVFAQVADGGGYRTIILLTNGSTTSTVATVTFTKSAGVPMAVTAGGTTSSSFNVDLPAGGAARLQTSGTPATTSTGWAKVTTSPPAEINGNAIFQLYSGTSLFCEASVPAASPGRWADFYADEEGGFNTAFALANPGSVPAEGTISLRNTRGEPIGSAAPLRLDPGKQTPIFLYQTITGATSGRAEISLTAGTVSVTALRFHASSLFSTIAVGQAPVAGAEIAALFSPAGGVRARLVSEISKAKSTIDVAIYSFTSYEIRDALIAAKNRGVAIRIVADSEQATVSSSQISALEQAGFSLKRVTGLSSGIMHNKYMVIDGTVLVTGSYNWSVSAESYNFENAVIIRGSTVVQDFVTDFGKLWAR